MIDKNITETTDCGKLWVVNNFGVNASTVTVSLNGYKSQSDLDNGVVCHTKQVTLTGLTLLADTTALLETAIKADSESPFYSA